MNNKEFKIIFGEIAKISDYKQAFGGWYKESLECIVILELQKSNFSDSYYLNIKVFIQGTFGMIYSPSKDLIKNPLGDITYQIRDNKALELDNFLNEIERKEILIQLFKNDIIPFTNNALTKNGIKEMVENKVITLLPAVKEELEKMTV